ncbi:hypothetical protein BS50DRAFT_580549 [Corynespora cassiicola Philippines]|uniref:Uncharacterized protein n=1 Tax=Corynespora cassiicola Philippines TaxID=1448308 RepID=A0A2T2N0W4_CORCC|nr:hypothetical protein BS50DRAFT_580549 [Corynespora cassiicola Philippines]
MKKSHSPSGTSRRKRCATGSKFKFQPVVSTKGSSQGFANNSALLRAKVIKRTPTPSVVLEIRPVRAIVAIAAMVFIYATSAASCFSPVRRFTCCFKS